MALYFTLNLQIKWIRHGYSCANYLYDIHQSGPRTFLKNILNLKIGDHRGVYAPDAKLTDITIKKICEMPKVNDVIVDDNTQASSESEPLIDPKYYSILDCDYFFCSELTRAAETAMLLCKNIKQDIFVIPYIGEKKGPFFLGDNDNLPSDLIVLKKNIADLVESIDLIDCNLQSTIKTDIIQKYRGEYGEPTKPSFNKFLSLFIPNFLKDYVIKDKVITNAEQINLKLSIVSHSHFIEDVTGVKLNNLDVAFQQISVKYKITDDRVFLVPNGDKLYIPILNTIYSSDNFLKYPSVIHQFHCIDNINNDTGSCKYSYTKYGLKHENNGLINIDSFDDIERCNFPQNEKSHINISSTESDSSSNNSNPISLKKYSSSTSFNVELEQKTSRTPSINESYEQTLKKSSELTGGKKYKFKNNLN